MSQPYQAVLLIAFGGPTSREEIRPFLARVTQGIPIPPERLEEVAHHYEVVGGKSPLVEITCRQAEALHKVLAERGQPLPVYVGMRNSAPFFAEVLRQMSADGVKEALGFILSPHRSEASWERYQKNIADARAEVGSEAPTIDFCGNWHDHALFIQSWAEQIAAAFGKIIGGPGENTPLVFTAHSLPAAMAARSPYVEQLNRTAKLIAERLDHGRWSLAYQSRSGKPTDPWLEPDIGHELRRLAADGEKWLVVAPIGFVCDHVEVLYDLDIEARQQAADLKMHMVRANCPNDHPTFIRLMAEVIGQKLRRKEESAAQANL